MIENTTLDDSTPEKPRRLTILNATTAYNLSITTSVIALTSVAPAPIAIYLSNLTLLVVVFLSRATLAYDEHYSSKSDRALSFGMLIAYSFAFTFCQAAVNSDLTSSRIDQPLYLGIAVVIIFGLAVLSSYVARLLAWTDFRIHLGSL